MPLQALQHYATNMGRRGYSPEVIVVLIRKVFETPKPKTRYAIAEGGASPIAPNPLGEN
ncbi:MAG: hypothetical protein KME57_09625 [Scytonema hyalinum WJT4-NPBG1]|jgi:hypothetical protein|nr:hypothetical protein [Scytonema hyalinum WJT4-NPBG1]